MLLLYFLQLLVSANFKCIDTLSLTSKMIRSWIVENCLFFYLIKQRFWVKYLLCKSQAKKGNHTSFFSSILAEENFVRQLQIRIRHPRKYITSNYLLKQLLINFLVENTFLLDSSYVVAWVMTYKQRIHFCKATFITGNSISFVDWGKPKQL